MKRTLFLAVSSGDAKLYLAVLPFGKEVGRAFPSADFDIWEATKCLALDRHTACVFHLMRVMELGLHALGKSLNDPTLDPKTNPSWFKILDRCSKELKKPLAQRSPEWQADDDSRLREGRDRQDSLRNMPDARSIPGQTVGHQIGLPVPTARRETSLAGPMPPEPG